MRPQASASAATILLQQALTLHKQGKYKPAEDLYKKALLKAPNHFEVNYLYGMLKLHQQDWAGATEQLGRAIKINPSHIDTYFDRATALEHLDRFEEAITDYDQVLRHKPGFVEARLQRAHARRNLQQTENAREDYEHVLQVAPDNADAWFGLGNVQHDNEELDAAIASYRKALELRTDFVEALFNLGNTYKDTGALADAEQIYRKTLEIEPGFIEALSNLSYVISAQGRPEEALAAFDQAEQNLDGDSVELWFNRGLNQQQLQMFDDAIASYRRAQEVDADYASAHWNEGLVHLLRGNFEEGWKKYEWRWKTDQMKAQQRAFSQPLWLNDAPLTDRTILLHAEQGVGDTLQFVRYAPLVAQRGGRVILQVPSTLKGLVHSVPGVSEVISPEDPLPAFDYHCPLMSLPLAFNMRSDDDIPRAPYLVPDAKKWASWYTKLGSKRALRIGLVWSGNAAEANPGSIRIDELRSIPFSAFAPLIALARRHSSLEFHSIQVGTAAAQLQQSPLATLLTDHSADLHDFSDTAALVANLDLIISVDTSVAHLAGALGKPVWLLNRFQTCWRWQLERTDSPWYSNFTIFRQEKDQPWSQVLGQVRDTLAQHLGA